NAGNGNGTPVDVSDSAARSEAGLAGSRNGKAAAFHRRPLRAEREGRHAEAVRQGRALAAPQLNLLRIAAAVCLLVMPAACMPLGDFERPRSSVIHDDVLPVLGSFSAKHRKEPVSNFPYTDAERELRDRSWSLLMPQLEQQHFRRWVAEMRRTRIMSVEKTVPDRRDYADKLLKQDF